MKVTALNRARRKLALEIVEYLERWIARHDGVLDVDEAAAEVSCLIPDTRAEVQADMDALDKTAEQDRGASPQQSLFGVLRAALRLDGCGVASVLKSAKEAVDQRDELKASADCGGRPPEVPPAQGRLDGGRPSPLRRRRRANGPEPRRRAETHRRFSLILRPLRVKVRTLQAFLRRLYVPAATP